MDNELEVVAPGAQVVRGEGGRFAEGGRLSPERAKEIGGIRRDAKRAERADSLAASLIAFLVDPEDKSAKAEAFRQILTVLGEAAMGSAAQRVRAVEVALGLVGEGRKKPGPGERCEWCGRDDNTRPINVVVGGKLAEAILEKYGPRLMATPVEGPS